MIERLRDALGLHDPKRILGYSFIIAVAVIWVLASFAVQGIESSGVHPAVLTFIANSLFALYLPIYWLNLQLQARRSGAPPPELQSLFSGAPSAPSTGAPHAASIDAIQLRQIFRSACVVRLCVPSFPLLGLCRPRCLAASPDPSPSHPHRATTLPRRSPLSGSWLSSPSTPRCASPQSPPTPFYRPPPRSSHSSSPWQSSPSASQ